MCATDTALDIALKNISIHSASLNALNDLVFFLKTGDPRRDNLMVGSISRKLLTELGIRTEDGECKLMGAICYFVNLVLIIKVVSLIFENHIMGCHGNIDQTCLFSYDNILSRSRGPA